MYIRNVFECREKYENYQVYNKISDENVFIIVLFCMLISVLITLSQFFSWKNTSVRLFYYLSLSYMYLPWKSENHEHLIDLILKSQLYIDQS